MSPVINLHGGPRNGTTDAVDDPWPRYQVIVDDGSGGTATYIVREASPTDADYQAPDPPLPDDFPYGPTGPIGPQGPIGPPGMTWRAAWDNATPYLINDAVSRNGSSYIAIANNTNVDPAIDVNPVTGLGTDWDLLAEGSVGGGSELNWLLPVDLATTGGLPSYTQSGSGVTGVLTATANGALMIDGLVVQPNYRVLVNQAGAQGPNNTGLAGAVLAKHSGVYLVTQVGDATHPWILTRATDANSGAAILGAAVAVKRGKLNQNTWFRLSTAGPITLDTTALAWGYIFSSWPYSTFDDQHTQANGAVSVLAIPVAARKVTASLIGDGATTSFNIAHGLNVYQLVVQGQSQSGPGNPDTPVDVDWKPVDANAISITWPVAPAAGVVYFITVIG